MVENLDSNRFCVHISARRTGKSYAAAILAFAKLLEPGQQVMVVAPNFSLSSIIWDYVTDLIKQLEIELDRFNQKDKVVKLINGSVFRLLSANNRDSLVGRAANLLIVDEAAIIPNDEYYTRDLRPALSTFKDSRCLWISTPRGKGNYLYEYYLRGEDPEYPDWTSSIHTWRSNPLLSENDVEEARKSITRALYLQEYECEWTTTESQVYIDLDEEKHVGEYVGERFSEVVGGLDVGYRDENVFVVIGTDGENYFIIDEFVSKESTTSELASAIQDKIDEWNIDTIYIDSAAQQVKADFAYDYDIYCENAIKSVNDGINSLQVLIEQDRLYFDTEGARHTFSAMSAYKWNPNTEKPKPIHDWSSHPCDAVRYAIYTHQKMSNITIYA
jgi:PBSX family phage terminase large subunit